MSEPIVVIKLDTDQRETWRYSGTLLRRTPNAILLEARFNRDDLLLYGMPLGRGDRFVEIFFNSRWFNIFEVHDRADDRLKGWYCNVCQPAIFRDGELAYVDLALDLLVFPDGRQLILDEDEFAELTLDEPTRQAALNALAELRQMFSQPGAFRVEQHIEPVE